MFVYQTLQIFSPKFMFVPLSISLFFYECISAIWRRLIQLKNKCITFLQSKEKVISWAKTRQILWIKNVTKTLRRLFIFQSIVTVIKISCAIMDYCRFSYSPNFLARFLPLFNAVATIGVMCCVMKCISPLLFIVRNMLIFLSERTIDRLSLKEPAFFFYTIFFSSMLGASMLIQANGTYLSLLCFCFYSLTAIQLLFVLFLVFEKLLFSILLNSDEPFCENTFWDKCTSALSTIILM